jgi:hypothetical protein
VGLLIRKNVLSYLFKTGWAMQRRADFWYQILNAAVAPHHVMGCDGGIENDAARAPIIGEDAASGSQPVLNSFLSYPQILTKTQIL